jgi:hypothetical protein
MTTKKKIAEQVLMLLKGGNPKAASTVKEEDLYTYIGQAMNTLFKTEQLSIQMPFGETIPAGAMLALYENLPVVAANGVSKTVLPAFPVLLPKNIGLFGIAPHGDWTKRFIPIPPGMKHLIKEMGLMNDMFGQVCFEQAGNTVWYDKDLTAQSPAVTAVDIWMVVMDISQYTDYDLLPVPADMEATLVEKAFQLFINQRPADNAVDTTAERQIGVK